MTAVSISRDDNIEAAVRQALAPLDLRPLIAGKHVAIKPNDTWASEQDTTAVTQGDTLQAVIRLVKDHGPRSITVSGGAGAAQTDEVFRLTGMMRAIEDEGVEFFDHNRPPFTEVALRYGPQPSVQVNPRILEYECVIVLSQLKVHRSATVTLALKNIAMSYPAADYYGHPRGDMAHRHHFFEDLHGFIAGMAQVFPVHLAVTVGHPAMVATGPIGGHTAETGLVFASTDALAADIAAAEVLGFSLEGVRHLWEAARLGLGDSDVGGYEFPLLDLDRAYRHFTERVYGRALSYSEV